MQQAERQKRVREHRLLQGSMMHHRADDRARGMEDAEGQGKMQAWRKEKTTQRFPVAMRPGATPVPIPNTKVKTWTADDTVLETARESRRLPDQKGGLAQLGEHLPCKQGVESSNLLVSIRSP